MLIRYFFFDSPYKEKFNEIRVKGDYDEVLSNIKNFMKIKKELKSDTPITRVQMVLMKENRKEWDDFQKLFSGIVDTIAYVDYLDHGTQKNQKDKGVVEIDQEKKILLPSIMAKNVCTSRWSCYSLLYR